MFLQAETQAVAALVEHCSLDRRCANVYGNDLFHVTARPGSGIPQFIFRLAHRFVNHIQPLVRNLLVPGNGRPHPAMATVHGFRIISVL